MPTAAHDGNSEDARIVLELLDLVERDGSRSQRRLAAELGIALGLLNAYLKRCMKKGLVKMSEAPARRYVYYLTPHGFAEKSRLTVEYLSYSFSFFRQARTDCAQTLVTAKGNGVNRVVLAGCSDLAEIATICALETGTLMVAVCDPNATRSTFFGVPLVKSWAELSEPFDAVMLTDVTTPGETWASLTADLKNKPILVPSLLRLRVQTSERVHHERLSVIALVRRADAGTLGTQSEPSPGASGFSDVPAALPEAAAARRQGRNRRCAAVSPLSVRGGRYGDAAVARHQFHDRGVAAGLQWRRAGAGAATGGFRTSSRLDDKGFIPLVQRPRFARGDKICVLDGVFETCVGLFENVADKERVAILLDLLGRKVRVVLDFDVVAAA